MSERYKIKIKYKHPRKVHQFSFDPEIEEDDRTVNIEDQYGDNNVIETNLTNPISL